MIKPHEGNLSVAGSMQRVILQYKIETDGSLTSPEVFGPSPLAELGYTDGIAFAEGGNLLAQNTA